MTLEDIKLNVKIKLSGLWASLMLIYIYADLFTFFRKEHLDDILAGELAGIEITEIILLGFMVLMTIPGLMVFLSLVLEAKINRWTNLIIGILQLVLVFPSVIGDANLYFRFASSVETVLLLLILWYAWTWPEQ
jgi:hypothetical protein